MIKVTDIAVENSSKSSELKALVTRGREEFQLFYRFPPDLARWIKPSADPFLAALLVPAMRRNERLVIDASASTKLFGAVPKVMELYHGWSKRYRVIDVEVTGTHTFDQKHTSDSNVALFFSLGMDSFYSLLALDQKSPGLVSHLIFVRGFDIKLHARDLFEQAYAAVKDVSQETGKELILATTNLAEFTNPLVEWHMSNSGALASIVHTLRGMFRTVYISSDLEPDVARPLGVHPDLDPLWSNEATTFIHYGRVTRIEKARAIADYGPARNHLRVCFENRGGAYNCCTCARCITGAMLPLHLTGSLGHFKTFPLPVTPQAVRKVRLKWQPGFRRRQRVLAQELRKKGDRQLADAMQYAILMSRITRPLRRTWKLGLGAKNRLKRYASLRWGSSRKH